MSAWKEERCAVCGREQLCARTRREPQVPLCAECRRQRLNDRQKVEQQLQAGRQATRSMFEAGCGGLGSAVVDLFAGFDRVAGWANTVCSRYSRLQYEEQRAEEVLEERAHALRARKAVDAAREAFNNELEGTSWADHMAQAVRALQKASELRRDAVPEERVFAATARMALTGLQDALRVHGVGHCVDMGHAVDNERGGAR